MKVLLAGGGTAGHINPALSIANIVKKQWPGAEIRFAGNPSGMEFRLVPQAGYQIYPLDVRGFRRKLSLYNAGTLSRLFKSLRESGQILREFRPDLVVGTGGYVSGPIVYRAAKMGIPTAIHEQNAYPGVTTRILARYVDKIMVTSEDSAERLGNRKNIVVTGLPVREDFIFYSRDRARRELGLGAQPVVLSFGGSLGARTINQAVLGCLCTSPRAGGIHWIHATGKADHGWFVEELAKHDVDDRAPGLDIREYINDMPRCFAAADLVICRSGASTLSELQVQGKPSILVPSPNVTANHQYYNALSLSRRGAALLIQDAEFTAEKLGETVRRLFSSPAELAAMAKAAASMAVFDVNERILGVFTSILK